MEEYVTGDIVLLCDAKIGILTSSSSVCEIHGDETDITRIVKKLTAKELAETLVDLMDRYNNLETKSSQHLLKEGNTESTTNTNTRSTATTTTLSCTKHTKSSKTTSSSEPKPKSVNNDLEIPKTPNYGNHNISPTDAKQLQHIYYGHQQGIYIKTKRGSDNSSVKSNDESATNTTTSTISDLSPNNSKSPKPKKKLFGKIRKTSGKNTNIYNEKEEETENVRIPKSKSSRFLFKTKNRKNTKKKKKKKLKRSKRSASGCSAKETHYKMHNEQHLIPQHLQHHTNPNIEYMGYNATTHEYIAPYHTQHDPHSHLHPHSHPDDIMHIEHNKYKNHHLLHNKTRFSRSKSTDNYAASAAYHHHHNTNQQHNNSRYHNPYFIAYTPSHNTNNSTITPPIPSPNAVQYHIPPYVNHYLHQLSPNTSSYSSTATAPAPQPMQPSPYALYNRYNLHFHPHAHYYSNAPNIETAAENQTDNKLIDVLLSVPHREDIKAKKKAEEDATTPNKKKSHPISYKKRTIKQLSCGAMKKNCADGLLMHSRTALTESVSRSQSCTPPTYPQQYVPQQQQQQQQQHVHNNQMILNLLHSPETQSVVDPIMANYSHIKHLQNRSNTIDTEDTTHTMNREREIYLNYNNYPLENSYSSNAKRDRKIQNQYISSNTHNNDSMIYNDSTSIRGGSHSPQNSSYSFRRKTKSHPYHTKRPFSATNKHQKHKFNNYFDFGAQTKKQKRGLYHKTSYSQHHNHAMNKQMTEIEGKNEFSSQNKTAAIKPFHPQKYAKPKLRQNYSSPAAVTHNDDDIDYLIHTKLKQIAYRKQRGKTMGNDIYNNNNNNAQLQRWYFASDASRNTTTEETETIRDLQDVETVINHDDDLSNKYNEGRKSQSFSVLALGKSLDDMTPLVLSPQSKQQAHHNKPRRSQSVADIFDPMQASHLGDVDNRIKDKNYKIVLHKAYYDDLSLNENEEKMRMRESTSINTAKSGESNNSFTPTMSQTPSYLREDAKWAKSMTGKISQSNAASQCSDTESDSRWMLHNQINVNGGNEARFFVHNDDDDEIGAFPEIHLDDNQDENKYKNQLSPTSNTSDTDTISKSYIY